MQTYSPNKIRNKATEEFNDGTTLTRHECISMMESAISVNDWNALREIVKRDYENKHNPTLMHALLHEIDGTGMIVRALEDNANKQYQLPVILEETVDNTLDDSEG